MKLFESIGYSADLNYPDKMNKTRIFKQVFLKLGYDWTKSKENKSCLDFHQN